MSNSANSTDPARNHPAKVIVLKNMQSFKFDPSKNFLSTTTNPDTSTPIINFKPQQLFTTSTPNQQIQLIATDTVPSTSVTVQGIQTVSCSSPKILIRAQPPQAVAAKQITTTTTVGATTVKLAHDPAKDGTSIPIHAVATLRNNKSTIIPKQALLIHQKPSIAASSTTTTSATVFKPSSVTLVTTPSTLSLSNRISNPPKLTIRGTATKIQIPTTKPIPIRPKVDPSSTQLQIKPQTIQQQVITIAQTIPATYSRFTNSLTYGPPVPALTLIQPKPTRLAEAEKFVEIREITPERGNIESIMDIRRIIEGDPSDIDQQVALIQSMNSSQSSSIIELDDSLQDDMHESQESSSHSLLCDEIIDSVTPENDKNKEKTTDPTTPAKAADEANAVEDVKKNLVRVLVKSERIEDEISASTSDESKVTDFEDSLKTSEIIKSEDMMVEILPTVKSKRARKPKNPTINTSMGLPYKSNCNRRSKSEMKLELELDFHDPINHIQWDDGVGGLDNCNKLFGFDEFGLVEILDKKDLMAKFRENGEWDDSKTKCKAKLKKITNADDQFICSVCSKHGTIRDFFSPETCSEACLAIMKRKTQCDQPSTGTRESSFESGMTTPVDERKLMFDGELIPLNQLHQHVFDQNLPEQKKKSRKGASTAVNAEVKFQWGSYLSTKSVPAPEEIFKVTFPKNTNPFRVAMKLEAIDPFNQKLFCICTVEEKLGYRIKLHFDGYSSSYDFWCNADSNIIFPAGFCQSTNRVLSLPPKWSNKSKFDWSEYLDFCNAIGAQRSLFAHLSVKPDHTLERGMKLEASYKGKLYVATIIDVLENRILIEYDVHPEIPCIWVDIDSPYIHPCNYHQTIDKPETFVPPVRPFNWDDYLRDTKSKQSPSDILQPRSPCNFQTGQKLEVVDPVNPQLIRPATILCREEYKIQVIFDGFDISFAFWIDDDSKDIFPINWCDKTGHPIEHPAGFNKGSENKLCKNTGCRGIGNAKHSDKHAKYFHELDSECPYNKDNWKLQMGSRIQARTEPKAPAKKTPRKQEFTNGKKRESLMKEEFEDSSMDVPEFVQPPKTTKPKRVIKKRKLSITENGQQNEEPKPKVVKSSSSSNMPTFLKDYGPQLNYSYTLWKKNSRVLDRAAVDSTENPMDWSTYKVCKYVQNITNSVEITKKFQDQDIDGCAFICLGQDDLVNLLNLKAGPAIKLYNRILHIREEISVKFLAH